MSINIDAKPIDKERPPIIPGYTKLLEKALTSNSKCILVTTLTDIRKSRLDMEEVLPGPIHLIYSTDIKGCMHEVL